LKQLKATEMNIAKGIFFNLINSHIKIKKLTFNNLYSLVNGISKKNQELENNF
jgi:hypothetical protein